MKKLLGRLALACAIVATLFVSAGPAQADNPGSDYSISNYGWNGGGLFTSSADFSGTGLHIQPLLDNYCAQEYHDIGAGPLYSFSWNLSGNLYLPDGTEVAVSTAQQIAYLEVYVAPSISNIITDRAAQADFQGAIWDLLYQSNNQLGGQGYLTAGALNYISLANAYVTGGGPSLVGEVLWISPGNGAYQDQIAYNPGGGPNGGPAPVPEPSSFALLGLGGIGLAFGAYRRRRIVAA